MFEREEKYRVSFIFYVKAKNYDEVTAKMKDLKLEDADEKKVVKFKLVK